MPEKPAEKLSEKAAGKLPEKAAEDPAEMPCNMAYPHIPKCVPANCPHPDGPLLHADNITMIVIRKAAALARGELHTSDARALHAEIARRNLAPGSNEIMKLVLEAEMCKTRAIRLMWKGRDVLTSLPDWLRTPEMISQQNWVAENPQAFPKDAMATKLVIKEGTEEETKVEVLEHAEGCDGCETCLACL
jgi:hypothetical protein